MDLEVHPELLRVEAPRHVADLAHRDDLAGRGVLGDPPPEEVFLVEVLVVEPGLRLRRPVRGVQEVRDLHHPRVVLRLEAPDLDPPRSLLLLRARRHRRGPIPSGVRVL